MDANESTNKRKEMSDIGDNTDQQGVDDVDQQEHASPPVKRSKNANTEGAAEGQPIEGDDEPDADQPDQPDASDADQQDQASPPVKRSKNVFVEQEAEEDVEEGEGATGAAGDKEDEEDDDDSDDFPDAYQVGDGFLIAEDEEPLMLGSDEDEMDSEERAEATRREEEEYQAIDEDELEMIQGGRKRKSKKKRLRRVDAEGRLDEEEEARAIERRKQREEEEARKKEKELLQEEEEEEELERVAAAAGGWQTAGGVTMDQVEENASIFGELNLEEFWSQPVYDAYVPDDEEMEAQVAPGAAVAQVQQSATANLAQVFEPAILEGQYLTSGDMSLVDIDIPERLQLRLPGRDPLQPDELRDEAAWIYRHAFLARKPDDAVSVTESIFRLLHYVRTLHFEIPYIYRYQRDTIPYLTEAECWEVFDWDERWEPINHSRRARLRDRFSQVPEAVSTYVELIGELSYEEEIEDLFDYLHFLGGVSSSAQNAHQRPQTQMMLSRGELAQLLLPLARQISIPAHQFGDNLWLNRVEHAPRDPAMSPEELAATVIGKHPVLANTQVVLQVLQTLMAREISYDPYVRQATRAIYTDHSKLSTYPTDDRGVEEINYWHHYMPIKRLEDVPLSELWELRPTEYGRQDESDGTHPSYAEIWTAEKEGFIQVDIRIPDPLQEMESLYLSHNRGAAHVETWNSFRSQVLQQAVGEFLTPRFQKEMRKRCERETALFVARRSAEEVFRRVSMRPLIRPNLYHQGSSVVVALSIPSNHKESIFVVALDHNGELRQHLKLSFYLTARGKNAGSYEKSLLNGDVEKLQAFVKFHQPACIGLGVSPGAARVRQAREFLEQDLNQDIGGGALYRIESVDAAVAVIYRDTRAAQVEFAQYPAPMREAISVARYMVNPLAETACLLNKTNDIKYLRIHPHQALVPEHLLIKHLERSLVTATAIAGVEINCALQHSPHLSNVLACVPGLGPRKARQLMRDARKLPGQLVENRTSALRQLLVKREGQDTVYSNAAAFLRITEEYLQEAPTNPLDSTRIHPHDYRFAYKIAEDAMEEEAHGPDEKYEIARRALGAQEELKLIDVAQMSDAWLRNKKEDKTRILSDLMSEMMEPWAERRIRWVGLSPERVFEVVTGETSKTLKRGMIVDAPIRAILGGDKVLCFLDNGIKALIDRDNLSDDSSDYRIDEKIHIGMVVRARVLEVQREDWELVLSCKSSDLADETSVADHQRRFQLPWSDLQRRYPYLLWAEAETERLAKLQEKEREAARKLRRQKKQSKQQKRIIDHPNFLNCTLEEAEEQLNKAQVPGDCIFRPSGKGVNYLTLSFVSSEGRICHIEIKEDGKENPLALGKVLTLMRTEFEDLDEIVVRYVQQVTRLGEELLANNHWSDAPVEKVRELLKNMKEENQKQIPYFFVADPNVVGWYKLIYLPQKITEEYITLRPGGFKFRRRIFPKLSDLVKWFKRHWAERGSTAGAKKRRVSKRKDRNREQNEWD